MSKEGRWSLEAYVIRKIVVMKESSPLTSNREVARVIGLSHPSVDKVLNRASVLDLDAKDLEAMADSEITEGFYPKAPGRPSIVTKVEPDFGALLKELETGRKQGLTRYLLWSEYQSEVGFDAAYGYSSFCEKMSRFDELKEIVMVLYYAPGEVAMVDYAGQKVPIYDLSSGEVSFEASIFVMVLGYSGYIFTEAQGSQDIRNVMEGHARGFEFFGGVPKGLIGDNLRAAVTKNTRDETILTRSYLEMCEHYKVIPAPARPYHPRDKAKVEASVRLVETHILAPLRKCKFFSLAELNEAIRPLVAAVNQKSFQKLPGSRQERYLDQEKAALGSLILGSYEYASWQPVKVGSNYHFSLLGVYYSVPFGLRGTKIMVRVGGDLISAYSDNHHVASHRRSFDVGSYVTDTAHMPEAHLSYLRDATKEITSAAKTIGVACEKVITTVLASHPFPQAAHKQARAILRLTNTYGEVELEEACSIAAQICSPTLASIKSILAKEIHKHGERLIEAVSEPTSDHANIRGSKFYAKEVAQ